MHYLLPVAAARKKLSTTDDPDKKAMYERLVGRVEESMKTMKGSELVDSAKDVLMEWLDNLHGSQVGGQKKPQLEQDS